MADHVLKFLGCGMVKNNQLYHWSYFLCMWVALYQQLRVIPQTRQWRTSLQAKERQRATGPGPLRSVWFMWPSSGFVEYLPRGFQTLNFWGNSVFLSDNLFVAFLFHVSCFSDVYVEKQNQHVYSVKETSTSRIFTIVSNESAIAHF